MGMRSWPIRTPASRTPADVPSEKLPTFRLPRKKPRDSAANRAISGWPCSRLGDSGHRLFPARMAIPASPGLAASARGEWNLAPGVASRRSLTRRKRGECRIGRGNPAARILAGSCRTESWLEQRPRETPAITTWTTRGSAINELARAKPRQPARAWVGLGRSRGGPCINLRSILPSR